MSARRRGPEGDILNVSRRGLLAGVGAGSSVLEIGTGWGELAIRAAARGARVSTVTLSTEQAELAVASADVVVLVVDATVGVTDVDAAVARVIQRSGRPARSPSKTEQRRRFPPSPYRSWSTTTPTPRPWPRAASAPGRVTGSCSA